MAPQTQEYWIFQANPQYYRIEDAIKELEKDTWSIESNPGEHHVKKGHKAIIWKAKGKGVMEGIIALAEILSDPQLMSVEGNPYWVDPEQAKLIKKRVNIRYIVPSNFPLWVDGSVGEFLKTLNCYHAQGSVFDLYPEQWNRILAYADNSQEVLTLQVEADIASILIEEAFPEGGRRQVLSNHYERDPKVRTMAIKIHGLQCQACGFSFETAYGIHGAKYIEVHHTKFLANYAPGESTDPQNDMAVLCANCHRMIHRHADAHLTVEALRAIIENQRR